MTDLTGHVLLIEDDVRLATLTRDYLERHGLVVSMAHDGGQGLDEALRHRFDLILLDLMLPTVGGVEVCRRVRERSDVPIIMITARGEEADRVLGLELGADDYVPKPFSARELLARIHAVLRRVRGQSGPHHEIVTVGDLVLDPGAHRATMAGQPLPLTSYEFALLYALAERAGRVLGRETLMELAGRGGDESFDRSIDVHVSRLRRKLGDDPHQPTLIRTVRGLGYQLMTGGAHDDVA